MKDGREVLLWSGSAYRRKTLVSSFQSDNTREFLVFHIGLAIKELRPNRPSALYWAGEVAEGCGLLIFGLQTLTLSNFFPWRTLNVTSRHW